MDLTNYDIYAWQITVSSNRQIGRALITTTKYTILVYHENKIFSSSIINILVFKQGHLKCFDIIMNISSLEFTRLIVILSLCCITFHDSVRTIQEILKKSAKNDSLTITRINQSKIFENSSLIYVRNEQFCITILAWATWLTVNRSN